LFPLGRLDPSNTWGSYVIQASADYPDSVCDCIRKTAKAIDANRKLTYAYLPGNDCWSNRLECNSNYTAKCLLRNCGIYYSAGFWGTWPRSAPFGWNHRMKKCKNPEITWCPRGGILGGENYCCRCDEYETVDTGWCGTPEDDK